MELQNDTIVDTSKIFSSKFTGDFKNVLISGHTVYFLLNQIFLDIDGSVVDETGRATLTIPGATFASGKDLIINFDTTSK